MRSIKQEINILQSAQTMMYQTLCSVYYLLDSIYSFSTLYTWYHTSNICIMQQKGERSRYLVLNHFIQVKIKTLLHFFKVFKLYNSKSECILEEIRSLVSQVIYYTYKSGMRQLNFELLLSNVQVLYLKLQKVFVCKSTEKFLI